MPAASQPAQPSPGYTGPVRASIPWEVVGGHGDQTYTLHTLIPSIASILAIPPLPRLLPRE